MQTMRFPTTFEPGERLEFEADIWPLTAQFNKRVYVKSWAHLLSLTDDPDVIWTGEVTAALVYWSMVGAI